jgi:threonine dehydrogenase-like Zn-dependent dehydrogenase
LTVGDILSTAYFAVDRAGVRPGDTVAVVGLGPVGLLVVEMSYIFGAARVVGLDVVRERLDAAERLGAVSVVANRDAPQAVRALTDGRGADAVVEAVGQPESLALALRLARGFAIISSAGVYTDAALPLSMPLLFERDLTLRAGMCNVPQVALHAMALVESGRIQPENLFSHELPLSDGPRAYRLFAERLTLKVLLRPWTSV